MRTTKVGMFMLDRARQEAEVLVAAERSRHHTPPGYTVRMLLSAYAGMGRVSRETFKKLEVTEEVCMKTLMHHKYVVPLQAQDRSAARLVRR